MRRALRTTGLIFLLMLIGHLVLMTASVQAVVCVDAIAVSAPGHASAQERLVERPSACSGEANCPAFAASVLRDPKIPTSFSSSTMHELAAANLRLITSASRLVPGRSPDQLRALLQVYRV